METIRYGDFSKNIHHRVAGQRFPLSGTIEVTRRCNLRCVHCYNRLPISDQASRRDELPYGRYCRILDEIAEAGCLWVLFTGGEILLRKDFLDLYAYAKRKGLLITLFTNGTLLTQRIADFLAEIPPFAIEITLYGSSPRTYEKISGVPGSFDKCMRGIRLLKERGLPLKLKTMALTLNVHEIWEIKRLAEEELEFSFKFDSMINPRIDSSPAPLDFRLSPQEIVSLDVQDGRRLEEWKNFLEEFMKPLSGAQKSALYKCGGGVNAFSINPYGFLSPCILSSGEGYDLKKGEFRRGWEVFFETLRSKKTTRVTKCTDCQLIALCGMCPANAQLENRDPELPIDFFCRVAHLRAHLLGVSIPPHGDCPYCEGGEKFAQLLPSILSLKELGRKEKGSHAPREKEKDG